MVHEKRKVTVIKVYKDGYKQPYRPHLYSHDANVFRIICKMRLLGMVLMYYDEVRFKKYTLMKFEKKI